MEMARSEETLVPEEIYLMDLGAECTIEEKSRSEKKPYDVEDNISAEKNSKIDVDPVVNVDSSEVTSKLDSASGKRKRSTENQVPLQDLRDSHRRSTRSRSYAQRTEEDIDSLRAELRSFLPTALLYSLFFHMIQILSDIL